MVKKQMVIQIFSWKWSLQKWCKLFHYIDEKNNDEEINVEETDFYENKDKENDDDDHSSASSEGFKKAVPL